jgi:hypothetical protein
MSKAFGLILLGGLLWASATFAVSRVGGGASSDVSRVGGGTMSNMSEGLQALDLPALFQQNDVALANGDVQLPGPMEFGGSATGAPIQQLINIYLLQNEFPALDSVNNRDLFDQYFLSRGWTKAISSEPCLEVFQLVSPEGYNMVVGWGNGDGLLLSGPNTSDVGPGIESAVRSIVLAPGVCIWK